MALPKLDVPVYELDLPSNGETISYRPFLVKEEKILLMAAQGDDQKEMVTAIKQIINNCIITKGIKSDKLPLFDIEYILLNLRSRSTGDVIKTKYVHKECKPVEIEININDIEVVKNPEHSDTIELTDTVGMKLNYPDITMMNSISNITGEKTEEVFDLIANCVDSVYDEDTVYNKSDYTPKELKEFVLGLTQKQFKKVEFFFSTLPKMQKKIDFDCPCGYSEHITLEGLQSFFG
jgi:hypothetical protein